MLISKFIYIYLLTALTKVSQVQCLLFTLQKLVVSPLSITKICSFITKVGSVRFFRLQKLLVSHLSITKICRVRIFLLQKFVVSAFLDYKPVYYPLCLFVVSAFFYHKSLQCALFYYKDLQCALFQTTKFCSVRIFQLQKFRVCAFSLQKFAVSAFFHYKSLQCP